MKLPRHLLVEAIAKRITDTVDRQRLAAEVAAYLLQEGRVAELEPILRDLAVYRSQKHGVVEAEAVSAHELDAEVIKDLQKLLQSEYPDVQKFEIVSTVNPELTGGLRLNLPGQQLDLSVRSKISQFKYLTQAERA